MKKRLVFAILALLCLLALTGCGCKHVWEEAKCEVPKTCTECAATEGEALGHNWTDATCTAAKTCQRCAATDGPPLEHTWADATCTSPKTCTACSATEGESLGHIWQDATTEVPKTCETCGETEGDRIITDQRFTTEACLPLFGSWQGQMITTAEENGLTGVEGKIVFDVVFTFFNDGTAEQLSTFADWDSAKVLFEEFVRESTYQQFAALGMDAAAADADMQAAYGMTVEQYAKMYVESIDPEAAASEPASMIYYTEGGTLYMAYSWDEEMQVSMWSIEDDKLTLITLPYMDLIELTRVTEE